MRSAFLILGCVVGMSSILHAEERDPKLVAFFESKIRPVFVDQCYSCHSTDAAAKNKLKGGLRLDTRAGLLKGGDSGLAIIPGDPDKGTLLKALRHVGETKMPPTGKLGDVVVADFVTWVKSGAIDPRDGTSTEAKTVIDIEKARREHWAYRVPVKPPIPMVKQKDWPHGEIDHFILARLEREALRPNGLTGKQELIRRASFALIGLPPTPQEIDAFLNDESPSAFARVVDRLLASPHYGERWARHWLDVARYAEDKALATAQESPHAFRYRDWVVQMLNRDMPYDQFLRLQLAGDLLKEPVDDYFVRLGGLGFQGLGQLYHRGNFTEQVMADELDDRVDTISRGLLGLTVACARCHDHKYDPIPTRDYYSLAAAYQGSNLTTLPLASPAEVERNAKFAEQLKQREAALNAWQAEQGRRVSVEQLPQVQAYLIAAWTIRVVRTQGKKVDEPTFAKEHKLHPYFLSRFVRILDDQNPTVTEEPLRTWRKVARDTALAAGGKVDAPKVPPELEKATDEIVKQAKELHTQFQQIELKYQQALSEATLENKAKVKRAELPAALKPLAQALLLKDTAPLFFTGKDVLNYLDEAMTKEYQSLTAELDAFRKSAPKAPLLVHAVSGGGQAMKIHLRGSVERKGEEAPPGFLRVLQSDKATPAKTFTRLDLAEAIVARNNPLTARVIVNRVWHYHFGRGIVATPSNFGKLGDAPSHPELLDYLAVSFMENGWSLKWLHRQILLSRTYQLSSTKDYVSEQRDPDNRLLWRWSPRRLDFEAWRDAVLAVSGRLDSSAGGPSQTVDLSTRRTVYSKISRSRLDPTLAVFDFPDANVSSEQRSVTTVAQQQLFVLNSGFMTTSAQTLAARIATVKGDDTAKIRQAYRLAYGREANAAELTLGLRFLTTASSGEKLTPWERYSQALLASNEFTWVP